ncbi:MAG: response regulator transcription factor [Clostridia bacterium]|nr:response regulator transcription factor [Clostridia bacterium]
MSKILIVEDEKSISTIIAFNLKKEGFETDEALDGITGLDKALSGEHDLILLDVMLPGMDGFEILRRLREKSRVPVIMVTAREEETDKILGLDTGADDYVTKPFSVRELISRVKANIRRSAVTAAPADAPAQNSDRQTFGDIAVDKKLQAVYKNGVQMELSQREYELICYFLESPDRVISREELMEKVWGYEYYGDLRAVDVAMRRLREKLEDDPAEPKYILTRRGAGYYLNSGK